MSLHTRPKESLRTEAPALPDALLQISESLEERILVHVDEARHDRRRDWKLPDAMHLLESANGDREFCATGIEIV
jgi:hypothetical protein